MDKSIKTSICEILTEFADCAVKQNRLAESYWTKQIIHRLADEGEKRCFEVYSRWHGEGEWIYDLCWIKPSDEIMTTYSPTKPDAKKKIYSPTKRLPLALECEWARSPEIEYDFEKLLWSRAQLRVMIFDATWERQPQKTLEQWAQNKIKELKKRIKAFCGFHDEGTYLFYVWCHGKENKPRFITDCYPEDAT